MKRTKMIRRIALSLAVAMLFSVMGVLPTGQPRKASALSQSGEYYQIYNMLDLLEMRDMISGESTYRIYYDQLGQGPDYAALGSNTSAKFELVNNIDGSNPNFSSFGWTPVTASFSGEIKGNGRTISNIKYVTSETNNAGLLFSGNKVSGAKISDITFSNLELELSSTPGYTGKTVVNNAGIVAGEMEDCSVSGITVSGCRIVSQDPDLTVTNIGMVTGTASGTTDLTSVSLSGSNDISIAGATNQIPVSAAGKGGTPQPTPTPTATPSPTPTLTPTPTPTATPTPTPLQPGSVVTSGTGTYVVIDGGVAFSGSTDASATQITIPDTITTDTGEELKVRRIQKGAFKNKKNIVEVRFGKYVEVVEASAFENCTGLKKITTSAILRIIDNKAFYNCTSLLDLKLPKTIERLGTRCFANCKKLRQVEIGVKETSFFIAAVAAIKDAVVNVTIGASAFENCAALKKVIINIQVRVIGNSAFSLCKKLAAIIVYSKQLKTVGKKALKGVHNCKISVPKKKLKPYKTLFKNRGQGKKVVVAKM